MHWSEKIALKVIERNPNKEEYVCAAGISPSGSVHVGNFRDIVMFIHNEGFFFMKVRNSLRYVLE